MRELAAIRRSSTTHPSTSVAILEQPAWSRKVSAASMYIPAMAQRDSVSTSSRPSGVVMPVLIVNRASAGRE